MAERSFLIKQPTSTPLWVFGGITLFLVLLGALLGYMLYSTTRITFSVDGDALEIHETFYGRTVPLASLVLDKARIVNLESEPELQPASRTNGVGLPGLQAGWFELDNGEKVLLFVSDRSKVLHIPTTEGYSLLMSPTDPEALLAALRGSS